MGSFEITFPPARGGGLRVTLSVEAAGWQQALAQGVRGLRDELGVDVAVLLGRPGDAIAITASDGSGCWEVSSPDDLAWALAVDGDAQREGAQRDGPEAPAHAAETVLLPAARPARPARPTLDTTPFSRRVEAGAGRADAPMVRHTKLRRTPPAASDPETTLRDVVALDAAPAGAARQRPGAPGRARVQTDRMAPRGAAGRAGTDPQRSAGAGYFKPVVPLDLFATAGDEREALERGLSMAWDHIPCDAAQILAVAAAGRRVRVVAARGRRSRDLLDAALRLPPDLKARLPDPSARNLEARDYDLVYEASGGAEIAYGARTALWLPVAVGGPVAFVLLMLDSRRRDGFAAGDLSGGAYLTDTLGRQLTRRRGA